MVKSGWGSGCPKMIFVGRGCAGGRQSDKGVVLREWCALSGVVSGRVERWNDNVDERANLWKSMVDRSKEVCHVPSRTGHDNLYKDKTKGAKVS